MSTGEDDSPEIPPDPAPNDPGSPGRPDSNEAPDVDPPAWEGAEPDEAGRGLIDPRPEIPTPQGL